MDYLYNVEIRKTIAGETFSKNPNGPIEISAGSKKTRLCFSAGLSTNFLDQTQTSVYVEKVGNGFFGNIKSFFLSQMTRKFIKYTKGNTKIYLNINSLSKRLGISRKEIFKCSDSEKKLSSLIENAHKSYLVKQKKIIEHFKRMTNKTIISKSDLYHAIGITIFHGFKGMNSSAKEIGYYLQDKTVLHLKKQEGEVFPFLTLFTKEVLGKGSYGTVQLVQELSTGRVCVAKTAFNKKGVEDLKNEYVILNKIFKNKHPTGIQDKHYELFDFSIENQKRKKRYTGYTTSKYDADLKKSLPLLNKNEKINCIKQILRGLVELEKQEICHGDIKENNCFIRRKKESIDCVIADFGPAVDMSKCIKLPKYGDITYRNLLDDFFYLFMCKKEDIKKLLFRRDMYAVGKILNKVFKNFHFKDKQTANGAKKIITKMTKRLWKKRISAADALDQFEKLFPY